jgi:hypothetical protein
MACDDDSKPIVLRLRRSASPCNDWGTKVLGQWAPVVALWPRQRFNPTTTGRGVCVAVVVQRSGTC